jgi:hypothetical protein
MQLAKDVRHGYENVEAQCPHCDAWSTFNVATDLRAKEPAAADDVSCRQPGCGRPFRLIGTGNHPFEHLIWDAQRLVESRYNMAAVLMASQAFEVFGAFYARHTLLYVPEKQTPSSALNFHDVDHLWKVLHDTLEEFAFKRIVNLLLNLVILNPRPASLDESSKIILGLRSFMNEPGDAALSGHGNPLLVPLLLGVKRTSVGTLRNRAVHNTAYRPTTDEAVAAVKEAGDLLFPLSVQLGVAFTMDPLRPGA